MRRHNSENLGFKESQLPLASAIALRGISRFSYSSRVVPMVARVVVDGSSFLETRLVCPAPQPLFGCTGHPCTKRIVPKYFNTTSKAPRLPSRRARSLLNAMAKAKGPLPLPPLRVSGAELTVSPPSRQTAPYHRPSRLHGHDGLFLHLHAAEDTPAHEPAQV